MDIPKLKKTSRAREYNTYTDTQRAAIVKQYLFDGKSHRRLDEDVLHLNSIESRGWQSMGGLHYLGLTNSFKALFEDMTISSAIYELESSNTDDYCVVIALLESLL